MWNWYSFQVGWNIKWWNEEVVTSLRSEFILSFWHNNISLLSSALFFCHRWKKPERKCSTAPSPLCLKPLLWSLLSSTPNLPPQQPPNPYSRPPLSCSHSPVTSWDRPAWCWLLSPTDPQLHVLHWHSLSQTRYRLWGKIFTLGLTVCEWSSKVKSETHYFKS